jgi:hypothetical protein
MTKWLWWTIGILCTVLFASLALFNAWTIANYFRTGKHVSAIPLLGGIAGTVAALTLQVDRLHVWWWMPLVLDYGSVPMFVYFFVCHLMAMPRNRGRH